MAFENKAFSEGLQHDAEASALLESWWDRLCAQLQALRQHRARSAQRGACQLIKLEELHSGFVTLVKERKSFIGGRNSSTRSEYPDQVERVIFHRSKGSEMDSRASQARSGLADLMNDITQAKQELAAVQRQGLVVPLLNDPVYFISSLLAQEKSWLIWVEFYNPDRCISQKQVLN